MAARKIKRLNFETEAEKLKYLYGWCNRGDYQSIKESCLKAVRKHKLPLEKAKIAFLIVVENALSEHKQKTGIPAPRTTKVEKMKLAKAMAQAQMERLK